MSDLLALKRRLQNIASVHDITDAMQIIATITIGNAQKFLNYRRKIQSIHDRLFLTSNLNQRKEGNSESWLIVFFSEKGFCGNFNPQILPLLNKNKNAKKIVIVGSRGKVYCERLGLTNATYIEGAKRIPNESISDSLFNLLKENNFPQNITVVINKYNNMFSQVPKLISFFPEPEDVYKPLEMIKDINDEYLNKLILERYVRAKLFYFFVQNFTGETAAKLLMMKNATDSAQTLKTDITLEVSRVRQSKITQELSEVISAYKVLQTQRERS